MFSLGGFFYGQAIIINFNFKVLMTHFAIVFVSVSSNLVLGSETSRSVETTSAENLIREKKDREFVRLYKISQNQYEDPRESFYHLTNNFFFVSKVPFDQGGLMSNRKFQNSCDIDLLY